MTLLSETLMVKGRKAEILTVGNGEPLVFLHGGGIIEGFDFLERLGDRFRVVAPLRPGYGGTDIDPAVTSRDQVVAYFADVLDELGIERTILLGHSLGGWLSATFAANYPDRVSELILAAPFGMNVPVPNMMAMTPEERYAALTNNPDVWIGRIPTGPDPEFAASRQREMESMGRFMTGPFDPELLGLLPRIKAPIQLLWGDDDKIVPFAHSEAWQEALPDVPLTVFTGTGHLLFHERREALDAIPAFVDASRMG